MIRISSTEFRDHQRLYLDKVDKGEEVIVQRGRNKAYAITPVADDDWSPMGNEKEKLDRAIEQAKNGETIKIKNIDEYLGFM